MTPPQVERPFYPIRDRADEDADLTRVKGRPDTAEGRYRFKTVRPGPSPVADGRMRTPHIHFKVARRGFHGPTTQMYFEGEELNAEDFLLKDLPPDRKDEVVIGAEDPPEEAGDDVEALYTFDLVLRRVERPRSGTSRENG